MSVVGNIAQLIFKSANTLLGVLGVKMNAPMKEAGYVETSPNTWSRRLAAGHLCQRILDASL